VGKVAGYRLVSQNSTPGMDRDVSLCHNAQIGYECYDNHPAS
jgi:hypothetical protein